MLQPLGLSHVLLGWGKGGLVHPENLLPGGGQRAKLCALMCSFPPDAFFPFPFFF